MKGLCLLMTLLAVHPRSDDVDAKDEDRIQGVWVVVAGERDGKATKDLNGVKWIFGPRGKMSTKRGDDEQTGSFKLAPEQKLKQIDVNPFDEPENVIGIYELNTDSLKICIVRPTKYRRPTDFSTKEGSGRLLLKLEREKK
jgi:uncharacterized protein (TIGR03067 family)